MKTNTLVRLLAAVFVLCSATLLKAQQGTVYETRTLKSKILNMERRYSIYLPPGYEDTDRSYPVLYLLHGAGDDHTGWVQFGQVQHIADKAIAEGTAGPMIIVMPDADTSVRGYFNAANGKFNYEDFFFTELIPHIEQTYRVRSERRFRAIAGLSMGGGGTLIYSLHRPEMFGAAAPLSAATGYWDMQQMKNRMQNLTPQPTGQQWETFFNNHNIPLLLQNATEEQMKKIKEIRWYISCGDDDFLYEGNSLLYIHFHKNEIRHEYRVKDGGHTWTYWRMELPIVLEHVSKTFMQH